MTCGLVHACYSLPEWQAVKLTFFYPVQCTYRAHLLTGRYVSQHSAISVKVVGPKLSSLRYATLRVTWVTQCKPFKICSKFRGCAIEWYKKSEGCGDEKLLRSVRIT